MNLLGVKQNRFNQPLFFVALTAIVIGYFMVWLPNEAAGLAFIGLEMGEEAKFLLRAGYPLPSRSFFYLPPVTSGLMLALATTRWPNRRWQTWAARGLAVLVSLLAFPALDVIGTEPAEWLWRVLMIALVGLVAVLAAVVPRVERSGMSWLVPLLLVVAALIGAFLPTWAFLSMRSAFSQLLQDTVGIGPGTWVSLGGHLLAAGVVWAANKQKDDASASSLGN